MHQNTDLPETLTSIQGCLGNAPFEAFAAATFQGRRTEASGILGAYAVPDCLDANAAAAFLEGLLGLLSSGRTMDGAAVLDDLTVQPCRGEVDRLASAGLVHAAALVAVVHEGYPADAALSATGAMAAERRGMPLSLVEFDIASALGELEADRTTVVVRLGKRVMSGHVRRLGDALVFDGGGEPVPVSQIEQAWRAVTKVEDRARIRSLVDGCLETGTEDLAGRIAQALIP